MMNYNIYTYIDNKTFLEIEKRLIPIEKIMLNKLIMLGWKLTKPIKENDALIIDFTYEDKFFMGNIGLVYIDQPDDPVFSLYVTKSYDELKDRYFVKQFVSENESLSFYEQNIVLLLNEAIALYKLWDRDYVYKNNISC